jgi:hypothetical protein
LNFAARTLTGVPVYDRGDAERLQVIDRWDDGVGWLAHPAETGRRASHAVRADDGVWVLDPVDAPGVDDLLAELGEVAGVAVLSSYHARDAGALAARHDVSVHIPEWMDRVAERVDGRAERYEESFGASGFEVSRIEPLGDWQEAVAYRPADGTLIVQDLLASGPGYTVADERVGVTLMFRLSPPREPFADLEPERILFGHGEGVFEDATPACTTPSTGPAAGFRAHWFASLGRTSTCWWLLSGGRTPVRPRSGVAIACNTQGKPSPPRGCCRSKIEDFRDDERRAASLKPSRISSLGSDRACSATATRLALSVHQAAKLARPPARARVWLHHSSPVARVIARDTLPTATATLADERARHACRRSRHVVRRRVFARLPTRVRLSDHYPSDRRE